MNIATITPTKMDGSESYNVIIQFNNVSYNLAFDDWVEPGDVKVFVQATSDSTIYNMYLDNYQGALYTINYTTSQAFVFATMINNNKYYIFPMVKNSFDPTAGTFAMENLYEKSSTNLVTYSTKEELVTEY